MAKADIGVIGLAVMGQNLVLNMERNGYQVAVYNRTSAVTDEFMAGAEGKNLVAAYDMQALADAVETPRRVLLMVKAGAAVDAVIDQLKPHLEPGDIIIDGGNSWYKDTERRAAALAEDGINFLGVGVSGGEEGALWGPSIMPGGQPEAYARVQKLFEDIAAKVNGEPCVSYLGPRGAGHYVKMVHNGIEYGVMQAIAEVYDLFRRGLGLSNEEMGEIFARWNKGMLESFLIEITAEIFPQVDDETGQPLVDLILDRAAQKGTGKWTSQDAMDLGYPIPTITQAVESRIISAYKQEREEAAKVLAGPEGRYEGDRDAFIRAAEQALYATEIATYAQGFGLMRLASDEYGYGLSYSEVAKIWRGGCIIRARFLDDIRAAFAEQPDLPNLLLAPHFREQLAGQQEAWRHVVKTGVELGIPVPALSSALAYYDSYRSARLPANLIQAQRDFFGAHTYERLDREGTFHTMWLVPPETPDDEGVEKASEGK